MLQSLITPIASLAGSWLDAKTQGQAAKAKLQLIEAESKAKILMSKETSTADWGRIMARKYQELLERRIYNNCCNDTCYFMFVPGLESVVKNGFDRLAELPEWYTWLVFAVCSAAIGIRGTKQFMGRK